MGFRFRKSFKIMPGVRINLSKSGTSLSLGGKGLTHNISSKGSRTTIGLPGTGLSYTSYSKSNSNTGNSQGNQNFSQQSPISTPAVTKVSRQSSFSRNLVIIGCVIVSVWAIVENTSTDAVQSTTNSQSVAETQTINPVADVELEQQIQDVQTAMATSDVPNELNLTPPELEVIRGPGIGGFMLAETEGRTIPDLNAPSEHQIKNGASITVKGSTKDKFWHVVVEDGSAEEYYVPANNVGTFTP